MVLLMFAQAVCTRSGDRLLKLLAEVTALTEVQDTTGANEAEFIVVGSGQETFSNNGKYVACDPATALCPSIQADQCHAMLHNLPMAESGPRRLRKKDMLKSSYYYLCKRCMESGAPLAPVLLCRRCNSESRHG